MSSSYIWICLMPLEFNMPDCHECKWTALLEPLNTTGILLKQQIQPGKCKHLLTACLFPLSFSNSAPCYQNYPSPPPPPPPSHMSFDFKGYTSITAGPSLTPLCHSDTTWYHREKSAASLSIQTLLSDYTQIESAYQLCYHTAVQAHPDTGSWNGENVRSTSVQFGLCRMCAAERWASDNFILQIETRNHNSWVVLQQLASFK